MNKSNTARKLNKAMPVIMAREEIFPHQQQYLSLLQERNRLVKQLKEKNQKQVDLERKEEGFTLYVNGANCKRPRPKPHQCGSHAQTHASCSRPHRHCGGGSVDYTEPRQDEGQRSKTAPSRTPRKTWGVSAVSLKTARGEKQKLTAPDSMTGNYDDDFEGGVESDSDYERETNNDLDDSEPNTNEPHRTRKKKKSLGQSALNRSVVLSREGSLCDQLVMSVSQLKKLRASLEMNTSIRESLALGPYNGDDWEHEEDIAEEVEEELSGSESSGSSEEHMLRPDDTIVLEFAPVTRSKLVLSANHGARTEKLESPRSTPCSKVATPRVSTGHNTRDIHMVAENMAAKKNRPLSCKKRSDGKREDNEEDARCVMEAMKAENERTHDYMSSPHEWNTHSHSDVITPTTGARGGDLNQDKLSQIHNKVMLMNPSQQRKLMSMLGQLDNCSPPKRTKSNTSTHTAIEQKECDNFEVIKIEIISNWGHPKLVGLTEIQVLDADDQVVPVHFGKVKVPGSSNQNLEPLFNGKYKTNKPRNMWACDFTSRQPITLTLPVPETTLRAGGVPYLKLWNYNKSINDLSIGVKRVRVQAGNANVFEGTVDKGCGNQVFDYGFIIPLRKSQISPNSVESSETNGKDEVLSENIGISKSDDKITESKEKQGKLATVNRETKELLNNMREDCNSHGVKNMERFSKDNSQTDTSKTGSKDNSTSNSRYTFPVCGNAKRSPSPTAAQVGRGLYRSLSQSSHSSASSNDSSHSRRMTLQSKRGSSIRSPSPRRCETRTINRSSDDLLSERPRIDSDVSSSENDEHPITN